MKVKIHNRNALLTVGGYSLQINMMPERALAKGDSSKSDGFGPINSCPFGFSDRAPLPMFDRGTGPHFLKAALSKLREALAAQESAWDGGRHAWSGDLYYISPSMCSSTRALFGKRCLATSHSLDCDT